MTLEMQKQAAKADYIYKKRAFLKLADTAKNLQEFLACYKTAEWAAFCEAEKICRLLGVTI